MKKRIFISTIVILTGLWTWHHLDPYTLGISTVQAVGDLTINWGVPATAPIFTETNVLPGDSYNRVIKITNNAVESRVIGIKGLKTEGTNPQADAFQIVISQNGADLYGGNHVNGFKTLKDFFAQSNNILGLPLFEINPGDSDEIEITVTMKEKATSARANQTLIFDLTIGTTIKLPEECQMNFDGLVLEGTSDNDRLTGSSRNDLILGREGNDRIQGGGGADCILTGEGEDRAEGGTGNDVILGEEGEDRLEGRAQDDILIGGDEADLLDGGSGQDLLRGNGGNDILRGGSGDDSLSGDEAWDSLIGGSGQDTCRGEKMKQCEIF